MSKLVEMFEAQRRLMGISHQVEKNNGFRIEASIPVDLDHPQEQLRLKEIAWRITEEIGEAILEAVKSWPLVTEAHLLEISDVTHFLIELMILSGLTIEKLQLKTTEGYDHLDALFEKAETYRLPPMVARSWISVILPLTQAMNELKNRPWKNQLRVTDREAFYDYLRLVFLGLIRQVQSLKINDQKFYEIYFQKNLINQNRQLAGV